MYPVEAFRKEQLLSDLKLCDQPPTMASQLSNNDGFWVTSALTVDSRDLASRLKKAGFNVASSQLFADVSFEVAEDLKNEAKDFAALGRNDLAQQFFRAALERAPDYISALLGRSNLAIDHALALSRAESNSKTAELPALAVSEWRADVARSQGRV